MFITIMAIIGFVIGCYLIVCYVENEIEEAWGQGFEAGWVDGKTFERETMYVEEISKLFEEG